MVWRDTRVHGLAGHSCVRPVALTKGETSFVELGLDIKPVLGNAIVFSNLDSSEQCDERMAHLSLPVTLQAIYTSHLPGYVHK